MNITQFLAAQLKVFEWPEKLTILVCGGRDFGDTGSPVPMHVPGNCMEIYYKEKQEQKAFIWQVLNELDDMWLVANADGVVVNDDTSWLTIVNGAARGADRASSQWVDQPAFEGCAPNLKEYPADWDKHGKSAGSIRNQLMLFESQPDIVLAFPGGRGTADMVRKAKQRGGKVIEVPFPLS